MTMLIECLLIAATTVFRLEVNDANNTTQVVGADGEKREVVLVEPAQYAIMTGKVDEVWRNLNSTRSGRISLHGKQTGTIIDEKAGTKTVTYEDGYKLVRPYKPQTQRIVSNTVEIVGTEKRIEFLSRMAERKKGRVRTITVEHNAATGKDTVK